MAAKPEDTVDLGLCDHALPMKPLGKEPHTITLVLVRECLLQSRTSCPYFNRKDLVDKCPVLARLKKTEPKKEVVVQ